jgi:hypothetical protein
VRESDKDQIRENDEDVGKEEEIIEAHTHIIIIAKQQQTTTRIKSGGFASSQL